MITPEKLAEIKTRLAEGEFDSNSASYVIENLIVEVERLQIALSECRNDYDD